MKAIILAAGQSKRLRPFTENTPKCLLAVRGKSIIRYQIEALKRNGIDDIVIVVGFQKQKIIDYLEKEYPECQFVFVENDEFENTGPSYSLYLAREHLVGDALYLNADVLYRANIVKRVRKHKIASVTAMQRVPWDEEQVKISLNENGSVVEIGKHIVKHKSHGEFVGVTKFGRDFNGKLIEVLEDFVSSGRKNAFAVDAINETIRRGAIMHAVDISDLKTIEIDTHNDLVSAEQMFGFFARFKHNNHFWSAKGFWARCRRLLGYFADQRAIRLRRK